MKVLTKALLLTTLLALSGITTANAAQVYIDKDTQTGITNVGMLATHTGGYAYSWDGYRGVKGDHIPGNNVVSEYTNNYFVFDLNALTSAGIDLTTLVSAKLELSAGTYYVPTDDFSYSVYDVSTNINDLLLPQKGRKDIFEDLQSGVKYGSFRLPYDYDQFTSYTANFNENGLNALKSTSGLFAIGGSFNLRLDGEYDTAYMMRNDGAYALKLQFATPVPEPETYGMLLAGLGLITLATKRRT